MAEAARMLLEHGVDTIDINMGCPVNRIAGAGVRSGDDVQHRQYAEACADGCRSGVNSDQCEDATWLGQQPAFRAIFARQFEQIGVAAVAIHERTRAGFRWYCLVTRYSSGG